MNSVSIFGKLEILLYSTLISLMSGISRLKTRVQQFVVSPAKPHFAADQTPTPVESQVVGRTVSIRWDAIQQVLLTLLMWIILGFAAGFLIGMIRPG